MSLYNSFDRNAHFGELASPLESQGQGVLTPAARRLLSLGNLYGTAAALDGTVLMPSIPGSAASQRLMQVPTVASGGVLAAHVTDAMTHSIRIRSDAGTLYYLMATTTVTNRTGGG